MTDQLHDRLADVLQNIRGSYFRSESRFYHTLFPKDEITDRWDAAEKAIAAYETAKKEPAKPVKLPDGTPYPPHGMAAYYSRETVVEILKSQGIEDVE